MYVSIAVALGYYAGESMGWGAWVGTLCNHITAYSDSNPPEGSKEGIHYLASKMVDPLKDWFKYCQVALTIRGVYWWLPTLIALYFIGIPVYGILLAVIALGVTFPLACELGYHSTKYWNFKFMNGSWEHQEVWYGLFQDVTITSLLIWRLVC